MQAKSLKDEGNAFFKEKNYEKAVLAYSEALKKKCEDDDLNTVLYTNRAAAHFHLGNFYFFNFACMFRHQMCSYTFIWFLWHR